MIDREAVREMARREYNLNHSAEQAFDRISRELNLGKPSKESKHLKSAAANKKFSMLSDNIQRIIADEYRQQQTKIACWTTSDIQALRLLSSRYSIGLRRMSDSEETNLLKFYDNFHGQEREISIENNMSIGECNVFTKLVPVTHRSLVLIEQTVDHSGYFFQLHLLGWNFNETKCQLTQSRTVYGFFDAIVFDERNSSKFALVYRKGCQRVRRGQIQDNKLKIDPRSYDINIGYGRSCFRFIDTKLQFLALGFEGIYSILISFYELDLGRQEKKDGKEEEKRPPRAKRLFVVEKEDNVDEHDLSNYCWFWYNDVCYAIQRDQTESDRYLLCKFDIDARKLKATDICFQGHCSDLRVEMDEILTACLKNKSEEHIRIHRFPTRQPDRLSNLTLFSIFRRSKLCEIKLYKSLVRQLPNKLKPFADL